jgi:ribosomal protein S12 methylthiotransferase accessory factor
MNIEMRFPGGLAVDAEYKGFLVHTDQPVESGGGGTAPSPFDLFLASIGTCAGLFALQFCRQRGIDTGGLAVSLAGERGEHGTISLLRLELRLPPSFPAKYREAIVRAVDQCTVKRHLMNPPAFEVLLTGAPAEAREPVSA